MSKLKKFNKSYWLTQNENTHYDVTWMVWRFGIEEVWDVVQTQYGGVLHMYEYTEHESGLTTTRMTHERFWRPDTMVEEL